MSASTAVILLLILFIVLIGVKSLARHLAQGCCGGGDAPRRKLPDDRNIKHYRFTATIGIDGMSCKSCAIRVENALNGLDGVWSRVDLGRKSAFVRMKQELSDGQLTSPVAAAGYAVREIRRP